MKFVGQCLMYTLLLAFLVACGKDNESGKSATPVPLPMGPSNPYSVGETPYNYQGVNIRHVLAQNPCINGYAGMPGVTGPYTDQRMPLPPIPLTNFKTVVPQGDIYVGVTSYGDVATVVGQGNNSPLFVAYLCPRSFTQAGTGQLVGVTLGANTPKCLFKPITAATMIFPGGATAEFRWLDGGTSKKTPFLPPVCIQP